MNNPFSRIGQCALLLPLLAGCAMQDILSVADPLPPCTAQDTPFAGLTPDESAETYHETVNDIIEDHLRGLRTLSTASLQCAADGYRQLLPARESLIDLASALPPWKNPDRLESLSQADIGSVLLEFLRTYECALHERSEFLPTFIIGTKAIMRGEYEALSNAERATIQRELLIARPALDRTLTLIGGLDRLQPLAADIECLKRTSLDLRNIVGLLAEATSCLARIEDARGSLRDPPIP